MDGRKKEYVEYTIDSNDIEESGLQKILTKEIIAELEPRLVGLQLLKIDKMLVGGPGSTRTFRYKSTMDMEDFNEGEDIPQVGLEDPDEFYSTVDVKPTYFGGGELIYGQAIIDSDFNVINDIKGSLADAHARKADARIWAELFNATEVVDETLTASGPDWEDDLDNDKVLYVSGTNFTNAITWELDYFRGRIKLSGDPGATQEISYVYTTRPVVEALTAGELSYKDVVAASVLVTSAKGTPDKVVVDPVGVGDLLVDDKFTHASNLGDSTITNGRIGRMAGMEVLVSHVMYQGVVVVCMAGFRLGYYVYKQTLMSKIDKLDKRPGDVYISAWEKSLPKLIDENMIAVVLNGSQLNASDSTAW